MYINDIEYLRRFGQENWTTEVEEIAGKISERNLSSELKGRDREAIALMRYLAGTGPVRPPNLLSKEGHQVALPLVRGSTDPEPALAGSVAALVQTYPAPRRKSEDDKEEQAQHDERCIVVAADRKHDDKEQAT